MIEKYNIITFENTHSSIAADKLLENRSIEHKLIAVPAEISAGCGFCLKVSEHTFKEAVSVIKAENIQISELYHVEKQGLKSSLERLKNE